MFSSSSTSFFFFFIHLTTQSSFHYADFPHLQVALGASTVVQQREKRESCCTHTSEFAIIHIRCYQRKKEFFFFVSSLTLKCIYRLLLLFPLFRNAGNAVLHPLLAVKDDRAQNGHFQIFRFGHFRGYWAQCHYNGHGILHDA